MITYPPRPTLPDGRRPDAEWMMHFRRARDRGVYVCPLSAVVTEDGYQLWSFPSRIQAERWCEARGLKVV